MSYLGLAAWIFHSTGYLFPPIYLTAITHCFLPLETEELLNSDSLVLLLVNSHVVAAAAAVVLSAIVAGVALKSTHITHTQRVHSATLNDFYLIKQ